MRVLSHVQDMVVATGLTIKLAPMYKPGYCTLVGPCYDGVHSIDVHFTRDLPDADAVAEAA